MTLALRATTPMFLQQGRGEVLTAALTDGKGQKVSVTGGAFSLLDADGTAVVDAEPVDVTNGVASYDLPDAFAAAYALPQHTWRARWALTGISGQVADAATLEQGAYLCRVAPVMHCTAEDLFELHSQWRKQLPRARLSYEEPIEIAWRELCARVVSDGYLPQRWLNWEALAVVHKYRAAHIVCNDFQTDNPTDSRWARLATQYWERAESEYEHHTSIERDDDEDGVADNPGQLGAARPGPSADDWPWGQQ